MADTQEIARLSEEFGVRLFTPPPESFEPLKATNRDLLVHGFPPRPDGKTQPELLARWERILSMPLTRIEPIFVKRTDRRHGPRVNEAGLANDTSSNWSGTVRFVPAGDSVTCVAGQWTVPDVVAPGPGNYYASQWVGIDGDGSPDVLQEGTETEIVGGVHHTYAWWEWYPDFEIQIMNLAVSAGDTMYGNIVVNSPTQAAFYLANITTGSYVSFTKTAPAGTTLQGNCAEWIVEAPTVAGQQASLADYGVVYIDECLATTKNNVTQHGGQGTSITMVQGGKDKSTPTLETKDLIKLTYDR